jgi:PIN domain nuclease of toxin-antitoxin system
MAARRRVVADTHAFIWWCDEDTRRLSLQAWRALSRADEVVIPDIVLWEVALLVELDRVRFDVDVRTWLHEALDEPRIRVVPINPAIAHAAVSAARWLQLDPADHLIAGTALALGAPLVTKDAELAKLPTLETVW